MNHNYECIFLLLLSEKYYSDYAIATFLPIIRVFAFFFVGMISYELVRMCFLYVL